MPERRRTPPDRRRPEDRREQDRRDAPRQSSSSSLRLLRSGLNDHEVLAGELQDVSSTGVRLETDRTLNLGERVLVEIRQSGKRCFNLPAEVVWVDSKAGRRPAIGCELRLDMTRKQFALLRDMVAKPAK
jgi:Tfp pilus assembly protein PilZ